MVRVYCSKDTFEKKKSKFKTFAGQWLSTQFGRKATIQKEGLNMQETTKQEKTFRLTKSHEPSPVNSRNAKLVPLYF